MEPSASEPGLTTSNGRRITTSGLLGSGGQGQVYRLSEPSGHYALKRYFDRETASDGTLQDRLTTMVEMRRLAGSSGDGHSLAWPIDLAWSSGRFVGYVMPLIDRSRSLPLHRIANPSDARRAAVEPTSWARGFDWSYLVAAAANLAGVVQALHDAGVVIGDFNENNVLVRHDARVTLLDCDSMQISDHTGRHFLCRVGRAEFTPPELLRADWASTVRAPSSDLFALAIHIHQLMMEGEHPFRGVWSGAGEKPTGQELATQGIWTHSSDSWLRPRPSGISLDVLTPQICTLFDRAFVKGAFNPRERPSAKEWNEVLVDLYQHTRRCPTDPSHVYRRDLPACPWCRHEHERAERRRVTSSRLARSAQPKDQPVSRHKSPRAPVRSRARRAVVTVGTGIGVLGLLTIGVGATVAHHSPSPAEPADPTISKVPIHGPSPITPAAEPDRPATTTTSAPSLVPDLPPTTTTTMACPTDTPSANVSISNETELSGEEVWTMDISGTVTNDTSAAVSVFGAQLAMTDGGGDQLQSQYLVSGDSDYLAPGQTTTLDDSSVELESSSKPTFGSLTLSWAWAADSPFVLCPNHISG